MEDNKVDFLDLKLAPGQVFQLEFEGYTATRDRAVLIGYRRNGSVIVSTPIVNGVPSNVKSGEKLNVRFFAGKQSSACAFQTEVIAVSKSPYPHLHLKIPEGVITGEVRGSVRADVEVICSIIYSLEGEAKNTSGKIVDLSMHGARMIGRTFGFENEQEILVVFKILVSEIEYELSLRSMVRSLNEMGNGMSAGLQFIDVPAHDKIALQAFVLSKVHDL